MDDRVISVIATKFFGFYPEQLYTEIYAVGYNEYLKAVSTLRETLLQEFPEKQEEIELNCSRMLDKYSQDFDRRWFALFLDYCSKNIFTVKQNIPIYEPVLEAVEPNRQAHDNSLNLRHCIMATEYLNVQLLGKLGELDSELEKRKVLLSEVAKVEQKLELVEGARELEQHLNAVGLPVEM